METTLSTDKEIPPVPKKTYQWEDLRRARECGGYPWTHLLKPPLEGDITAEDVLRETTPRRSMSREFSRSRTRSPVDNNNQKILQLDSSPGSSRKHGEEGEDEGVQIPHFSQEVSLDSDGDAMNDAFNSYISNQSPGQSCSKLSIAVEVPRSVSPKGILKRRVEDDYYIGVTETRENSKCCHPLVNKIKHLADKTLQRLEKVDGEKSPTTKRKKNYDQEIRQLNSSPGAIRRQKFGAIKLGDSDEMSKTLHEQHPQQQSKKEHIYEDIDQSKLTPKYLQVSEFSEEYILCNKNGLLEKQETDSQSEKKSVNSEDPSLIAEDINELKPEDHIMEKLHKIDNTTKEALVLEDELDDDEPNVEEVFQNQLDEVNKSNTVVITELTDEESEMIAEEIKPVVDSSPSPVEENPGNWSKNSRRWTSEGGTPLQKPLRPTREGSVQSFTPEVRCACQFFQSDSLLPERLNPIGTRTTSRASYVVSNQSDHEYEFIEKPPPNIVYTAASVDEQNNITKTEDELSSTTSLERNFLRNTSFEEYDEELENNRNDIASGNYNGAEKNMEDRYFANTPSTVSRTECDISTSQVDSSALENLPLKRENRNRNGESMDNRIQQKLREGTGKLKTQAGKLKIKLQSIRNKQFSMPERPKFSLPERAKFKMPERPKISLPDRPKFNLPERRKFSLPERSKFRNFSDKLSIGDRKKFTLPDRPKFNMPDLSKIKFAEKPKLFLTNLGKRMQSNPEGIVTNIQSQSVEYEVKTYPRLLQRKKKTVTLTSSSPSLNREETPPPVFKFTRKKLAKPNPSETKIYNVTEVHNVTEINNLDICEDPVIQNPSKDSIQERLTFDTVQNNLNEISPLEQECKHVINEINNDEFFIRPRGISRENIQVREYLSDEIRQAFKIPKNSLAAMEDSSRNDHNLVYENDEGDPELLLDDTEIFGYSNDNINDRDDGYYTFPPARPSRAKQKKRELESVEYIDEHCSEELEFNDLNEGDIAEDSVELQHQGNRNNLNDFVKQYRDQPEAKTSQVSQYPIIDYENSEMEFPDILALQSQTLPMPPRRKRRANAKGARCSSFTDIQHFGHNIVNQVENNEEISVYRTEHEYIVPDAELEEVTGQSPIAPRRMRNKSRCSQGTSLYDDDRTSHGAESLTLDTHVPPIDDFEKGNREFRQESPGYATVDKTNHQNKPIRRSFSKTPPLRRRKSDTLDRKYYTVGSNKQNPDRPPRKKSSQSLVTLNDSNKISTGDVTQYAEIDDFHHQEIHRELISGEVINKMKDRPLPPPPRPPRESKEKKKMNGLQSISTAEEEGSPINYISQTVVETEVSTQTDPLPDDVDFELGMDENLDFSVSSSVRELDEDQMTNKSLSRRGDSVSRPTSRSEKSFKASDPKISELSKSSWGRTSPTVILVERRVSSPTRINQREEMLTEASLTVQHIDIDGSNVSDFPLLPGPRKDQTQKKNSKDIVRVIPRDGTLNNNAAKNIQLETLITEHLHVKDLEVGRLNVSELQANKIKVSDIEGMTLQISELESKSGHISLSGVEFSQNVIDEIVKKFAAISTGTSSATQNQDPPTEIIRPESREEETQTEETNSQSKENTENHDPESRHKPIGSEDHANPPQRPPPPDLTPLLYSYLHDMTMPPSSLYHIRSPRERPFTEFHEAQHHSPPPATRRARRKPTTLYSASSSDSDSKRPSSRRPPPNLIQPQEPTVSEAGAQFLRVCHNSISRSLRNIFQIFMTYISGTEDKRDVQMALVIFLVLIAGLILFGISDSRTIHHHHWEFFNPPDSKPL